ncbi:MAG: recombination-associated protein RdgC [Planctomycetota bacterium]
MRIKASGSFRRYYYEGPALDDAEVLNHLARLRFRSIDHAHDAAVGAGWVTLRSPVDTHFDGDVWHGTHACFAVRIDRKRLPKNALKVRLLERLMVEKGKLNPQRKREIKDEILAELMPRLVPATSWHQVLWDRKHGVVYFASTSEEDNRQFLSLFRESFDAALLPLLPAMLAERVPLPPMMKGRLTTLVPTSLIEAAQETAA